MILFFENPSSELFLVHIDSPLNDDDVDKLEWLFGGAKLLSSHSISNYYVGPRANMITPWSTNAVEITQNMHIYGILRIEKFKKVDSDLMISIRCFLRNLMN